MSRLQALFARRLLLAIVTAVLVVFAVGFMPSRGLAQDRSSAGPAAESARLEMSVYTDMNDTDKRAAAQSLAQWLGRASGRDVAVSAFPASPTAQGIYVGLRSGDQASIPITGTNSDKDKAVTIPPAYTIDIAENGQVFIDSPDTTSGLRMAVYDFLQTDLGFVFWSFDESELPSTKPEGVRLKPGRRDVSAAFSQLFLWNREADSMPGDFRFVTRSTHGPKFTDRHNLYALLSDFGRTNPQIYPMNQRGDRLPNDLHMCYTADGLAEAVADNISDAVRRRRGNVRDWIYMVGPGEGQGGFCLCDACNRVYDQETWTDPDGQAYKGYSGALVRMMNKACAILEKRHPGIKVGTLASGTFDAPPGMTRPAANLVVQLQRTRIDCFQPITKSAKGRQFVHKLNRWSLLASGRVYLWEPGTNFQDMLAPFPNLHALCENIALYQKSGVAGLTVQANSFSPGGDAVVLKNWVVSRKMWDPGLDTDTLIKTFCDGYYGPASAAVQRYFARLQDAVSNPRPILITELDEPNKSYLTADLSKELQALLDEAGEIVRPIPEPYGRRVRELRAGLDAARLALPAALMLKEGRLVRADFDRDMLAQTLVTIQNLRLGTPRQTVTHAAFAQWLLRNAGGPSVTLSAGRTSAVVAPTQAEVWRVTYNDVAVIENLHGLPRGAGEFSQTSGTQASFVGPAGIGPQSSSAAWLSSTSVELGSQDRLQFTSRLQQLGANKFPHVVSVTDYPAPASDRVIVEVMDRGQFVPVIFRPGESKVSMGRFQAVRVRYNRFPLVITDNYPGVLREMTGELSHDRQTGTVRVHVVVPDVETTTEKFTVAIERVLTLTEPASDRGGR